jgi:hypothetical protein
MTQLSKLPYLRQRQRQRDIEQQQTRTNKLSATQKFNHQTQTNLFSNFQRKHNEKLF